MKKCAECLEATARLVAEATPLTFDQLRVADVDRCNAVFHRLEDWSPADWAMAAAGELGELCNLLKKRRRGEEVDDIEIGHELADTVTYLDLLAARLGINLGERVQAKFNLVSERRNTNIRL